MKQVTFLFVSLIIWITSFSQEIVPVKDGKIVYSGVITVDSTVKAGELYSRAKNFLAHEYKSAKAVIQVDDKDGGQIVGKGNFIIEDQFFLSVTENRIDHTVSIFVKDGKYKYEISDFYVNIPASKYYSGGNFSLESYLGSKRKIQIKILKNTNTEVLSIIEDLKKAMNNPINTDF